MRLGGGPWHGLSETGKACPGAGMGRWCKSEALHRVRRHHCSAVRQPPERSVHQHALHPPDAKLTMPIATQCRAYRTPHTLERHTQPISVCQYAPSPRTRTLRLPAPALAPLHQPPHQRFLLRIPTRARPSWTAPLPFLPPPTPPGPGAAGGLPAVRLQPGHVEPGLHAGRHHIPQGALLLWPRQLRPAGQDRASAGHR